MASHSNLEFKMGVVKFSPSCSFLYLFAIFLFLLFIFACLHFCLFVGLLICFEVVHSDSMYTFFLFSLSWSIFFCALSTIKALLCTLEPRIFGFGGGGGGGGGGEGEKRLCM